MILNFLKGFQVKGKRKATNFEYKILNGIKIHTIRWDAKLRWRKGRKIHFSTGSRTSKYNCFKEGLCTGTQSINIENNEIFVDSVKLNEKEIALLAKNDGFDNVSDFWEWFNQYKPFTGVIIHWTDFRYDGMFKM